MPPKIHTMQQMRFLRHLSDMCQSNHSYHLLHGRHWARLKDALNAFPTMGG